MTTFTIPEDSEVMTGPEVARLFRVSPSEVQRWWRNGRITGFKTPGGRLRFWARQFDYARRYLRGETIPYGEGIGS